MILSDSRPDRSYCTNSRPWQASMCWSGCGEGYVARLVAQAGAQSVFGIDISSEMVGVHDGWRERCTVPDEFRERECYEFSGLSAEAIRPGDRRVYAQLFELR